MKKTLIIGLVLAFTFGMVGTAMASTYSVSPTIPTSSFSGEWSHGNYRSATPDVCKDCHAVHGADAGSLFLLRAPLSGDQKTVSGTCMTCHDGSSTLTWANPYNYKGTRLGYGNTSVPYDSDTGNNAVHYCDVTVTYTDYDSNIAATQRLNCGDCHNVHGADVTTAFVISGAYGYNPIIGNRIGPNSTLLAGDGYVTQAYAALCGACHNLNDQDGQATNVTAAFIGTTTHPSVNTRTTWGYNTAVVGGQMTAGASSVIAWNAVANCNSCHMRLALTGNNFMSSGYRANRTDAYQLSGVFHGGLIVPGAVTAASIDSKFLSASYNTVDENCLACHRNPGNSNGVGISY